MKTVEGFKGSYAFLSNFEPCEVHYDGDAYPTVEHAFQAAKTFDPQERSVVRSMKTPAQAKKFGRKVTLRADWEDAKDYVMFQLLRNKFGKGTTLAQKLLDTGDATLVEANWWHDNYWGDCKCARCKNKVGRNTLGKLLMRVRKELRASL